MTIFTNREDAIKFGVKIIDVNDIFFNFDTDITCQDIFALEILKTIDKVVYRDNKYIDRCGDKIKKDNISIRTQ